MGPFSIENVKALVSKAYLTHARDAFGEPGTKGITELLDAVKLLFQRCPPENLKGTLTVVKGITSTPLTPAIAALGLPVKSSTYESVAKLILESHPLTHAIVEIVEDGTFRSLIVDAPIDLDVIAINSLVYYFEDDTECILAGAFKDFVPKVSPILRSNFATPTLSGLEAAFERYSEFVLESRCRIIAKVWEGGVDGPRLLLTNKPEALMRDSLIQALELLTRDTTVRPEQNTDETKPVDIRIEWFGSGAPALIEVKWLGKSIAKSRDSAGPPTYTEYGPPRAQEGADQLADYMDRDVRHSNATAARGYLAVFDARRRSVKGAQDRLTKEDAMHFAAARLTYNPDHSATRSDFAPPVRFYLKPRSSYFVPA